MKRSKRERFYSAWYEVVADDETGKPYWRGAGAGDKEESRFDESAPLTMDPAHFPPGTRIDVSEPDDPEFYERLFAERNP